MSFFIMDYNAHGDDDELIMLIRGMAYAGAAMMFLSYVL